jgi:beta-lactamase regulating signal transducer with metallopeptidase domain
MSLPLAQGFDSTLLRYVLEPAARSLALGGAVWLLLAAFRVRDVGFRLAAWTAVLYAALAMPFLGQMMPGLPVLLPAVGTARASAVTQQPVTAVAEEINQAAAMKEAVATYVAPPTDHATTFTASAHIERAGLNPPTPTETLAVETSTAPSNFSLSPPAASPALPSKVSISSMTLAAGLYGLIAAILLGRLGLGLALSRRIARAALPIEDERLGRLLERESRKVGLRRTPRLGESEALSIPAAMGFWRPVVLLPRGWEEWSDSQIEAVLAHELSHIARRDPLTQTLSNLHRAIFWFSPLGWWLDRIVVELAEQASDDAALRAGADRTRYAEVLLHFFRALRASRGRVRWQAVSMAQGSRSARRVERILSGSSTSIRLGRAAVVAVAIALVPLACLAAAVEPSFSAQTQLPAPPPPMAPPAPPAGALVKTPAPAPVVVPVPAPAPKAPTGPTVPPLNAPQYLAAPMAVPAPSAAPFLLVVPAPLAGPTVVAVPAPRAPMIWFSREMQQDIHGKQSTRQEKESWYSSGDCGGNEAYVIVFGNRTMTACGSPADMTRVDALRRSIPGNFLWFRRDGRSYVVRDAATVNAAIQAFAPQQELARQQAELGRQQAMLGAKQAAMGMQQAQVRVDVPDFSAAMKQMEAALRQMNSQDMRRNIERAKAQMEATLKTLDSSATPEELGRAQEQLAASLATIDSSVTEQAMARVAAQMAEMQSRLGALQSVAGEKQAALGARQAELGRQQAQLGRQQEQLGRRQAELARKAAKQMRELIDHALKSGLAHPQ